RPQMPSKEGPIERHERARERSPKGYIAEIVQVEPVARVQIGMRMAREVAELRVIVIVKGRVERRRLHERRQHERAHQHRTFSPHNHLAVAPPSYASIRWTCQP